MMTKKQISQLRICILDIFEQCQEKVVNKPKAMELDISKINDFLKTKDSQKAKELIFKATKEQNKKLMKQALMELQIALTKKQLCIFQNCTDKLYCKS